MNNDGYSDSDWWWCEDCQAWFDVYKDHDCADVLQQSLATSQQLPRTSDRGKE